MWEIKFIIIASIYMIGCILAYFQFISYIKIMVPGAPITDDDRFCGKMFASMSWMAVIVYTGLHLGVKIGNFLLKKIK